MFAIIRCHFLQKTPDNDFIIDKHPKHSNIIIGVGFSGTYINDVPIVLFFIPSSGHGFKLAPVVGKILCEMTMDLPLSYDISPFAVNRFNSSDCMHQGHTI